MRRPVMIATFLSRLDGRKGRGDARSLHQAAILLWCCNEEAGSRRKMGKCGKRSDKMVKLPQAVAMRGIACRVTVQYRAQLRPLRFTFVLKTFNSQVRHTTCEEQRAAARRRTWAHFNSEAYVLISEMTNVAAYVTLDVTNPEQLKFFHHGLMNSWEKGGSLASIGFSYRGTK